MRKRFTVIMSNGSTFRLRAKDVEITRSAGDWSKFEFSDIDRFFSVRSIEEVSAIVEGWHKSVKP